MEDWMHQQEVKEKVNDASKLVSSVLAKLTIVPPHKRDINGTCLNSMEWPTWFTTLNYFAVEIYLMAARANLTTNIL